MIGLDLETAPCEGQPQPYALQPWRAREGTAHITSCAIAKSSGQAKTTPGRYSDLKQLLIELDGKYVATWNGLFDVAWLLAYGLDEHVKKIKWVDAMLLWKWVENSQSKEHAPAWSLMDGAKRWLKDWPHLDRFKDMKSKEVAAGEDDKYWEMRGKLDALVTVKIAEILQHKLTDQQRKSVLIEAACIIPAAKAWIGGINIDTHKCKAIAPIITDEMRSIEVKLGVCDSTSDKDQWKPSTLLSSPKKLSVLLYTTWGLPCSVFSDKTGAPSSNKTALTYLADTDPRVLDILRWRELNTQYTKFVKGIIATSEYINDDIAYPSPKIFSTYTGRFTYASRSGKKGENYKAKVGIPIHQFPRNKTLRKLIGS